MTGVIQALPIVEGSTVRLIWLVLTSLN
jgi:hypothetical protein